jgi:hypothetical protein
MIPLRYRGGGGNENPIREDEGEAHDQADAEWIVIRRQLRGHNDTPFGRPAPGRPSGRPGGLAALQAYFVCFSY